MSGEPSVTISDHESAGDRDDEDKEHEETKRLLYVALTRARDRLYLGRHDRQRQADSAARVDRARAAGVVTAAMAAGGDAATIPWPGASTTHALRPASAARSGGRRWYSAANDSNPGDFHLR